MMILLALLPSIIILPLILNIPLENAPQHNTTQHNAISNARRNAYYLTDVSDGALVERLSSFCHANGIKYVEAATRGPSAYIFVDFGEKFEVHDADGEVAARHIVASISNVRVNTRLRV